MKRIIEKLICNILDTHYDPEYFLNNNNDRDTQSLSALDAMTIEDMELKLLTAIDRKTSQSVTVLLYADQHKSFNEGDSSFEDLYEWKKTRKFQ